MRKYFSEDYVIPSSKVNEAQKKVVAENSRVFLPKLRADQKKDLRRQLKCYSLEISFPPQFGTMFGRNL